MRRTYYRLSRYYSDYLHIYLELQRIVEPMRIYALELKNIMEKRDRLKLKVLDMDSARSQLQSVLAAEEKRKIHVDTASKIEKAQSELTEAQNKVDQLKEDLLADMYTLEAREIELASVWSVVRMYF